MPELAEVETVRRIMERALAGRRIRTAEVPVDEIVTKKTPNTLIEETLIGAKVESLGRKGKLWWIGLHSGKTVFGHLGMAGWIRELGEPTIRLKEHGEAPLDDENGRPRFLKMLLETDEGRRIALTDGRRLARLWLGEKPEDDKFFQSLGPDMWTARPPAKELHAVLKKRKAAIKALMLDQKLFAGVGNWLADEALFQARIRPSRPGEKLSLNDVQTLLDRLGEILDHAVEVGADEHQFPDDWLFKARWGGHRGSDTHLGYTIQREEIGGRTTAWIRELQK